MWTQLDIDSSHRRTGLQMTRRCLRTPVKQAANEKGPERTTFCVMLKFRQLEARESLTKIPQVQFIFGSP